MLRLDRTGGDVPVPGCVEPGGVVVNPDARDTAGTPPSTGVDVPLVVARGLGEDDLTGLLPVPEKPLNLEANLLLEEVGNVETDVLPLVLGTDDELEGNRLAVEVPHSVLLLQGVAVVGNLLGGLVHGLVYDVEGKLLVSGTAETEGIVNRFKVLVGRVARPDAPKHRGGTATLVDVLDDVVPADEVVHSEPDFPDGERVEVNIVTDGNYGGGILVGGVVVGVEGQLVVRAGTLVKVEIGKNVRTETLVPSSGECEHTEVVLALGDLEDNVLRILNTLVLYNIGVSVLWKGVGVDGPCAVELLKLEVKVLRGGVHDEHVRTVADDEVAVLEVPLEVGLEAGLGLVAVQGGYVLGGGVVGRTDRVDGKNTKQHQTHNKQSQSLLHIPLPPSGCWQCCHMAYNGMEIYIESLFKGYVPVKVTSMKKRIRVPNPLR